MFTWHRYGSVTVAMVRSRKRHCYETLRCIALARFSITVEKESRVKGDTGKIKWPDIKKAIDFVTLSE